MHGWSVCGNKRAKLLAKPATPVPKAKTQHGKGCGHEGDGRIHSAPYTTFCCATLCVRCVNNKKFPPCACDKGEGGKGVGLSNEPVDTGNAGAGSRPRLRPRKEHTRPYEEIRCPCCTGGETNGAALATEYTCASCDMLVCIVCMRSLAKRSAVIADSLRQDNDHRLCERCAKPLLEGLNTASLPLADMRAGKCKPADFPNLFAGMAGSVKGTSSAARPLANAGTAEELVDIDIADLHGRQMGLEAISASNTKQLVLTSQLLVNRLRGSPHVNSAEAQEGIRTATKLVGAGGKRPSRAGNGAKQRKRTRKSTEGGMKPGVTWAPGMEGEGAAGAAQPGAAARL